MKNNAATDIELLRRSTRDIVTGEPLQDDARPDLFVGEVREIADRYELAVAQLDAALEREERAYILLSWYMEFDTASNYFVDDKWMSCIAAGTNGGQAETWREMDILDKRTRVTDDKVIVNEYRLKK